MNIQIRTKEITLNDSTKAHIEAAIEQFKKFSMDITTTNVVLTKEKNGVGVEFEFHIAHNTPIVINQSDRDLDAVGRIQRVQLNEVWVCRGPTVIN